MERAKKGFSGSRVCFCVCISDVHVYVLITEVLTDSPVFEYTHMDPHFKLCVCVCKCVCFQPEKLFMDTGS